MDRYWRPAALAFLVLLLYIQTAGFGFLNFDDDGYVTANSHVLQGLTWNSVVWAFTSLSRFYWHPLTWLSLMSDVQVFGPSPAAMHAVNVAFHLATTLLLYVLLCKLTGAQGRSFTVAALFAVHPLRVESVAWIAERKDVLCAFFTVLTLLAYQRHARNPTRLRYAAALLLFLAACMAKPMAVTIPILLLLLDFWPLQRRALVEKLPFVAVAALLGVLTFFGAQQMGSLEMLGPNSWLTRCQNAIWSLGQYLRQTVLPTGFAIVYPYPRVFPGLAGIAVALSLITAIAVWQRQRRPWILTGWLWFVLGIAPALGLIQAGVQARADRFTYIPHVGLFLAMVWTAADFLPRRFHTIAASATILSLAAVSYGYIPAWRSSQTVFAQALANTSENWLAEYKYGTALLEQSDGSSAAYHLARAASFNRADPHSRFQLGRNAAVEQRPKEAERWFAETVRLQPDYADAHFSRARMLTLLERTDEAILAFKRALELGLAPEWAYRAHLGVGTLLARSGRALEAERHFQSALAMRPESLEARRNLASAQERLRIQ